MRFFTYFSCGFFRQYTMATCLMLVATISYAYNVVSEEDKSLDIYGSVRGYVGLGGFGDRVDLLQNGAIAESQSVVYGSALYGVQSNSYMGVRGQFGNVRAQAEMGYAGSDGLGGFRLLWGSYDFGRAGTLLFGKHNTPSVAKPIFASNVLDTDQGQRGFGAISTANYKFQFAYILNGFTIALIDDATGVDNDGVPPTSMQNEIIPRIALSYYVQEDGLDMQIGGSYKYYNLGVRLRNLIYSSSDASGLGNFQGDGADRFANGSGHAFHIFVAIKSKLLEDRLYVSTMAHYGMNADLYDEQRTGINATGQTIGGYSHQDVFSYFPENILNGQNSNIHRVGGYFESGYAINDSISGVLGFGYQYSAQSSNVAQRITADAQNILATFQLPIILDKGFIVIPHLGYYGTLVSWGSNTSQAARIEYISSLIALAQLRYNF